MKIIYKIERIKIKKSLFKHSYVFILYKNVMGDNSIGSFKLFKGSYQECLNYAKNNKIPLNKTISKDV